MATDAQRAAAYKALLLKVLEVQSQGSLKVLLPTIYEAVAAQDDLQDVPGWDDEALAHVAPSVRDRIRENFTFEQDLLREVKAADTGRVSGAARQAIYRTLDADRRECLMVVLADKPQRRWLGGFGPSLDRLTQDALVERHGVWAYTLTPLGRQIAEGVARGNATRWNVISDGAPTPLSPSDARDDLEPLT